MFLTDVPQSFSIMLTLPVEHSEKVEVARWFLQCGWHFSKISVFPQLPELVGSFLIRFTRPWNTFWNVLEPAAPPESATAANIFQAALTNAQSVGQRPALSRENLEGKLGKFCQLLWSNLNPFDLFEPIRTFLNLFELIFWNHLNLIEPIWTYLNLFEPIWIYLNLFEAIWTHLNSFEPTWTYLNLFESLPSTEFPKQSG